MEYPGGGWKASKLARALGVHVSTVVRWLLAGLVEGVRTPGGQWRIADDEARRVLSGGTRQGEERAAGQGMGASPGHEAAMEQLRRAGIG